MIILLTLTVGVAVAQDGPPSRHERVKALEPFIGFWQGTFQPPGGPEGTIDGWCRWTSNQSYAQWQWSFTPNDGERIHILTVQMGWNGKPQGLCAWVFLPEGQSTGVITVKDHSLSIAGDGTSVNGQNISSQANYELDGDKLTVTFESMKVGDQELPGYWFTVQKQERPRRGNC